MVQTVDVFGVSGSFPSINHQWVEIQMLKYPIALACAFAICCSFFMVVPAKAQDSPTTQTRGPRVFTETSIEKGWKRSLQQKQPMLVMFTSDNCKFCKKMLAETYGHPAIEQMLASHTQTVLAHKKNYEALVKKLNIRGYPSSVLISPKGDVLEFVEGFLPPNKFAERVVPVLQKQARENQLAQQTTVR